MFTSESLFLFFKEVLRNVRGCHGKHRQPNSNNIINTSLCHRDNVWQYFTNKCIDNLHVVLSMSPTGDVLRTRCRSFPGLVNNTCIDWMFPWPTQALYAVATRFLKDVSYTTQILNYLSVWFLLLHSATKYHKKNDNVCYSINTRWLMFISAIQDCG